MKRLLIVSILFLSPLFAEVEGGIEVPFVEFPMEMGEGVYSTKGNCNMCHSFGYVLNQGKQSRKFWMDKTIKMIEVFHAPIRSENIEIVVNYLYENYGNGKLE